MRFQGCPEACILLETAERHPTSETFRGKMMNAAKKKPSARPKPIDPIIPDKLYFRIGEVAELCDLPTYVLRFWETEFPQLRPTKSSTGQRMYRRTDVDNVLKIRRLLYQEGFTIAGARQQIRAEAKAAVKAEPLPF